MGLLHNWNSDDEYDVNPLCKKSEEEYDGNLLVSSSMQEDIDDNHLVYENSSDGTEIVNGIMNTLRITDVNIACDAALDQDVSQEIGFLGEEDFKAKLEHEELMDQLAREAYGVCEQCNGTGFLKDQNE